MNERISLSWDEFKKEVISKNESEKKSYNHIIYRGHSSADWTLDSTLYRFLGNTQKTIKASFYFSLMKKIIDTYKVEEFTSSRLPEKSPFLLGMLVGLDPHRREFLDTISMMVKIRHLGFPSPILDWTTDPFLHFLTRIASAIT